MNDPFSLVSREQTYGARQHDSDRSTLASNGCSATARGIRATRLEDLPSVAALLAESFYPPGSWLSWLSPLLRAGIYQELRGRLGSPSPNHSCLVAVQETPGNSANGSVLGTIEVTSRAPSLWQLSVSKYPYISNLAVKSECRRRGVAQRLLLACEQMVLEWGFQDLYLHVLENNQPARRLYAKVGYQVQNVDYIWPQFLFGQPRRLLLHKHLTKTFVSQDNAG